MNKYLIPLLLCAAFFHGSAARADERPAVPDRIATAKKVRIAVNAGFPPMEMRDPKSNELIGFDIDFGNAIAAELGLETEWVDGAFEQMIPALVSKRVDLIISGISDLPERRATADFIDYLKSGTQIYAMTNGPLSQPSDLCGHTATVSLGTSMPDELKKWAKQTCDDNGKPPLKIILDNNLGQQIINLKQGRAQAAVQALEGIDLILEKEKGAMKLIGQPIHVTFQGIAFRKDDTVLRDAFFWAVKRKFEDGTYAKLLEKWKLTTAAYPTPTINKDPE
ncbi:ABC transporter substrate-binding protein [Sinorhizobium medicae]|uniref:Transporter substrate-binding domain-containing protein n=1 Tax=Sinorhizobium medicae TaxID=110321 RepID=A0A6G1WH62_9HYPH|nr:ABC transporter substrate-binding protein [Sinorhizobium medicae]MDX0498585.1 transporter substrate-binding domain-containing protein [Sinorhizobium medicae]MDX0528816.1 transporter substrate-binding domain-containing protein [Sinorhizobium medicae]MDX0551752.1 transporter substrate-binding domain-containing protein [Sinorhizobium medicae]MDX1003239.1 transporter substrate-binding domain-containing protein [Sinorhizobium medicae]MDX1019028.1 transporter substrate-binding domain-containing p